MGLISGLLCCLTQCIHILPSSQTCTIFTGVRWIKQFYAEMYNIQASYVPNRSQRMTVL